MALTRESVAPLRAPQARASRRGFLKSGLGLIGVAGLGGGSAAAYGVAEASFDLRVTDYRPVAPQWPAGRRLSIGVIADLHAGGPNVSMSRVREVVDTTNALGCDLVVLLGDFFADNALIQTKVSYPDLSSELARLRAPFGVYSVLGNHDWWHDLSGARKVLADARIPLLENDAVLLGPPGRKFWLAGLGDQIAYRLGRGKFRGVDDLPGTMAKIRTSDPVVMLVHEPDIFPEMPDRVALTLAGHTHGGQIRIPGLWQRWTPSAYGARFAYGHIVERNRHMIVSGGIGTSLVPVRLGVPPEIVRVVLGS